MIADKGVCYIWLRTTSSVFVRRLQTVSRNYSCGPVHTGLHKPLEALSSSTFAAKTGTPVLPKVYRLTRNTRYPKPQKFFQTLNPKS